MRRAAVVAFVVALIGLGVYLAEQGTKPAATADERASAARRDALMLERPNSRALGLWLNFKQKNGEEASTFRVDLPAWPIVAAWSTLFMLCLASLGFHFVDFVRKRSMRS